MTGPVKASPNGVDGEVEKLKFLRGLGADTLDLSALPAERRRHLAQSGRRLTAQALVRREPNRRHPILLTLLAQSSVDVLDSVVQLFDQTLSGSESRARHTEYMGLAVDQLREAGRDVDAEVLAHISPARSSAWNYYGSITVDYERELAQLDDKGHRPADRGRRRPSRRAVAAPASTGQRR